MGAYTSVSVIYNPKSTGPSETIALEFKKKLESRLRGQKVKLIPTKRAGDGKRIAFELAKASSNPLIISSSGDGGYHEIVNGLVKAQEEGAKPVAGLLPAGNANDHYHNLHEGDIYEAIKHQHERRIDLLKLSYIGTDNPRSEYAHSYIGVGLTPKAGQKLNRTKLNKINEIAIVLKVLFHLRSVQLQIDNRIRSYDSVIFSNVNRMSKVLEVSQESRTNDGKFEVIIFRRRNKLKLITILIRASVLGIKADKSTKKFNFKCIKKTLIQLDGEIVSVRAGTHLEVSLVPAFLRCIV